MGKGWICLHREIQDNSIWKTNEPFDRRSAWIDLLLTANHEDRKVLFDGHMKLVKRGQLLTSVVKLSERWGWGRKKTLNFLRLLEEDEMVIKESDNRATLLTLVNYAKYQGSSGIEEQQTTQLSTQLPTQQGNNSRPTNNNYNNYNKENNNTDRPTFTPYKSSGLNTGYKKTAFHNYQQNDYDFEELERYLLERSRPK